MKLRSHIILNGQAEEAIEFYWEILWVEQVEQLTRYSEIPGDYTEEGGNRIVFANLHGPDFDLRIWDAPLGQEMDFAKSLSICIMLGSEAEGKKIFDALSEGGHVEQKFEPQFWGHAFGIVTDKFGINWMVNAEMK